MRAPVRWQYPVGHATPVRSPGEVSVADSARVVFDRGTAWAFTHATRAAGSCRSPGCALAASATAADTCGVAIDVPWMLE